MFIRQMIFILLSLLCASGYQMGGSFVNTIRMSKQHVFPIDNRILILSVKNGMAWNSGVSYDNRVVDAGARRYYSGNFKREVCSGSSSWTLDLNTENGTQCGDGLIKRLFNETTFNKGAIVEDFWNGQIYRFDFGGSPGNTNITRVDDSSEQLINYMRKSSQRNRDYDIFEQDRHIATILSSSITGQFQWNIDCLDVMSQLVECFSEQHNVENFNQFMFMSYIHVATYEFLDYDQRKDPVCETSSSSLSVAIIIIICIVGIITIGIIYSMCVFCIIRCSEFLCEGRWHRMNSENTQSTNSDLLNANILSKEPSYRDFNRSINN